MSAAEPAVAGTAPTPELKNSRFTYFIHLPDDYERRVSEAYFKTKYPNSQAKRVGELNVGRLTDLHSVITLVRPRPTAAATPHRTAMGSIDYTHHEPETKIAEVRESRPILVKHFWTEGGDDSMVDGQLNISEFLTALSQAASPITLNWHPDQLPGIVKLSWV